MVALIEVSEQSNEEEETLTAGKSCRRALTVLEQKGTWHYSTQIIGNLIMPSVGHAAQRKQNFTVGRQRLKKIPTVSTISMDMYY